MKRVTIKKVASGSTGVGVQGDKGEHLEQGKTYDVSDDLAAELVLSGRAVIEEKKKG